MTTFDDLTSLQRMWEDRIQHGIEVLQIFYVNEIKRSLRKQQARRLFHRDSEPLIIDLSEKSHLWYETPGQIEKYPGYGVVDGDSIANLKFLIDKRITNKEGDSEYEMVDWGCYDGKKSIEIAKHIKAKKLHLVDNPFALVHAIQNCTKAGIEFRCHERGIESKRLFEAGGKKKIHLFVGNTISNFGRGKNLESILEHLSLQMDIGADLNIEWTNHPKEYYEAGYGFMGGYLTTMDPTIATDNLEFRVDSSSGKEHVLYFELKNRHTIKDREKSYEIPPGTKMIMARIQRFQDELVDRIEKYGLEAKTLDIENGKKGKVLKKGPYRYAVFGKVKEYKPRRVLKRSILISAAMGAAMGGYFFSGDYRTVCTDGQVEGTSIFCYVDGVGRRLDIAGLEEREVKPYSEEGVIVKAKSRDAKYLIFLKGQDNFTKYVMARFASGFENSFLKARDESRCTRERKPCEPKECGPAAHTQFILDCTGSREAAITLGLLMGSLEWTPDTLPSIVNLVLVRAEATRNGQVVKNLVDLYAIPSVARSLKGIAAKAETESREGTIYSPPNLLPKWFKRDFGFSFNPMEAAVGFLGSVAAGSNPDAKTYGVRLVQIMGGDIVGQPLRNYLFLPSLTMASRFLDNEEFYGELIRFSGLTTMAVEDGYTVPLYLSEAISKIAEEWRLLGLARPVFDSMEFPYLYDVVTTWNKMFASTTGDSRSLYFVNFLVSPLVESLRGSESFSLEDIRTNLEGMYSYTKAVSYRCVQDEVGRICGKENNYPSCESYFQKLTALLPKFKGLTEHQDEQLLYNQELCKNNPKTQ